MNDFPVYQIFGLRIASDFPFANHILKTQGPANLVFRCLDQAPFDGEWQKSEPSFVSPYILADGRSILTIYQTKQFDVLHFSDVADFYCWADQIVCHVLDEDYAYLVEIHFLGRVLAYWLEKMGGLMLHASAVSVDGRAVAFLAANHGGKSSLAAAMMQMGLPLLTDDILHIEGQAAGFVAHAGYPQMRFWAEDVNRILDHAPPTERIHPLIDKHRVPVGPAGFGQFHAAAQSMACFYLPQQRLPQDPDRSVRISAVPPTTAVIELLQRRFFEYRSGSKNEQSHRFQLVSQLVRQIPVRKISYPSGFSQMPRICRVILEDVAPG